MSEGYANNFVTALTAAIDADDVTIGVRAAAPVALSGTDFRMLIGDELLIVTAGEGTTTWTVTRGAEGTTAAAHAGGSTVAHVLTKASLALVRYDTFDVRAYGATGDGTTDDTAAIRAAIASAEANGGGTVYIPAGTYVVQPQVSGEHCLTITGSNITIAGDGPATLLSMRVFGGGDPTTTWEVIGGAVHRGYGIHIVGGGSVGATQTGVTIRDLAFDGRGDYTGDPVFPADVDTGDGWDLTHKCIAIGPDTYADTVVIERCHLYNWRGEIIYGGGSAIGSVTVRDSDLHDTNGDCWSVTGDNVVVGNRMHRAAHACIEDILASGDRAEYRGNAFYDGTVHTLVMLQGSAGEVVFEGNRLYDHSGSQSALRLVALTNAVVKLNTFVDCAQAVNTRAIEVTADCEQVQIVWNTIQADAHDVQMGIALTSATVDGITIADNWAGLTPAAIAAGKTMAIAYQWDFVPASVLRVLRNTAHKTTYWYTDQMVAGDVLLSTTGATVLTKVRPARQGNFMVMAYLRVITGATNAEVVVEWTDGTGTNWLTVTSGSHATGAHTYAPVFVNAVGSSEGTYVKVTATAGTANQVYVSAAIVEVA